MKQLTQKIVLGLMMAAALCLLGGCASEEAKEPETSTPPAVAETTEPEIEEKVIEEEEVIAPPVETAETEVEDEISEPSADAEPVEEESKATITIKEEIIPYVGIFEEDFEQKTGVEVDASQGIHRVIIPENGVEAAFFCDDSGETTCFVLSGKISDFLDGVAGELTLDELVAGLSNTPEDVSYEIYKQTETIGLQIDSDGDGKKDLQLDIDQKREEMITADSPAYLGER